MVFGTVGDLVEDVVVHLGGPINLASDTDAVVIRRRGGSAANAAAAAARSGAPARFIGQVGDDSTGSALIDSLAAEGVDLVVRRQGRSGTVVVLVDQTGERTMLSDRATCADLADPEPVWLDGLTILHVPTYSLIEGSLADTAAELVHWAHERGITVSIDTSSVSLMERYGVERLTALYRRLRPDVVLCNEDESACLGNHTEPARVGARLVVVKRGPAPAVVVEQGRAVREVPVPTIAHVGDTTGAGDSFAAGFLTSWAEGQPVLEAVTRGHRAAAAAIERASSGSVPELSDPF